MTKVIIGYLIVILSFYAFDTARLPPPAVNVEKIPTTNATAAINPAQPTSTHKRNTANKVQSQSTGSLSSTVKSAASFLIRSVASASSFKTSTSTQSSKTNSKKSIATVPTKNQTLNNQVTRSTEVQKQKPVKKITTKATTVKPQTSPPKKYVPASGNSVTNGPLKINLPTPKLSSTVVTNDLVCPKESEAKFQLFAIPCRYHQDCTSWNKEQRCCKLFGSRSCIKAVPKPLVEQAHSPIFGVIPRKCPKRPLAELWWELKVCETDNDCWPRICCPDGQKKYCRTSAPEYKAVPSAISRPLTYLSEYLECTPAPPPVFDLHPKQCNTTLDCFPNVCCQEAGLKHCRPPKKSILTLMANFLNTGLLRRFTENIVFN